MMIDVIDILLLIGLIALGYWASIITMPVIIRLSSRPETEFGRYAIATWLRIVFQFSILLIGIFSYFAALAYKTSGGLNWEENIPPEAIMNIESRYPFISLRFIFFMISPLSPLIGYAIARPRFVSAYKELGLIK